MKYDIKIVDKGDCFSSLSAGVTVCKALNIESLQVHFEQYKFSITARKESHLNDLVEIYNLTVKNQKLKP